MDTSLIEFTPEYRERAVVRVEELYKLLTWAFLLLCSPTAYGDTIPALRLEMINLLNCISGVDVPAKDVK